MNTTFRQWYIKMMNDKEQYDKFTNQPLTDEERKICNDVWEKQERMEMKERLENWFTYHRPEGDDASRYEKIREAGLEFATLISNITPPSADQTAAIRKVREAVMTANAAIACKGK